MSNNFRLMCNSHNPPLMDYASESYNWADDALADAALKVRVGQWPQKFVGESSWGWDEDLPIVYTRGEYTHDIGTSPVWFLRQHPFCEVWVVSEYGMSDPHTRKVLDATDPLRPGPSKPVRVRRVVNSESTGNDRSVESRPSILGR